MSSSTSSFSTELKVIASVIVTFLAIEVGMRFAEQRLSLDVKHIRQAPNIAQDNKGKLALGNSLLREGVDMAQLPGTVAYHPDGTSIQEWAYAYRRYFDDTTDQLFLFTGRTHLRDLSPSATALGAFYCSTADIPTYFQREGSTVESNTEFLLARFSAAYAQRARIQPRVFTAIIPHFQTALREMNARVNATKADRLAEWTYNDLDLLLSSAKSVTIITVPSPTPYSLPQEILSVAEKHNALVIDIAAMDTGLSKENFPDGSHLDAEGGQIFTTRLLSELKKHAL